MGEKTVSGTVKEKVFKKFDEVLPDSARISINQRVENLAASLRISTESTQITLKEKEKNLRKHKIEWTPENHIIPCLPGFVPDRRPAGIHHS